VKAPVNHWPGDWYCPCDFQSNFLHVLTDIWMTMSYEMSAMMTLIVVLMLKYEKETCNKVSCFSGSPDEAMLHNCG